MTPTKTAEAFMAALRSRDREAARSLLDPGASFLFPRSHVTGAAEVADHLCGSAAPIFQDGEWEAPREDGGVVFVSGRQSLQALERQTVSRMYDALVILEFSGDKIAGIKLQPTPLSREPGPAPLKLTQAYKDIVNNALDEGAPMLLGFVDENNQTRITPRGSIQAYSDTQLSVWIRDRENSSFLKGIARNPKVALYYMNLPKFRLMEMTGRARVDEDPQVRDKVYTISPEPERDHDFVRHGVAVIIDLETLEGSNPDAPGTRLVMKRT